MSDNETPTPSWSTDGQAKQPSGEMWIRVTLCDGRGGSTQVDLDPDDAQRMAQSLLRRSEWARGQSPNRNQ